MGNNAHGDNGDGTRANGAGDPKNSSELALNEAKRRELVDQLRTTIIAENAYASAQQQPVLANYLAVLRRRWQPMLAIALAVTAVITYKMRPGPPNYTAITRMLLPTQAATASQGIDLGALTGQSSGGAGMQVATVIGIVTSPPLVRTALGSLPPALRTRGWTQPPRPGVAPPNLAAISWWDPKWGLPSTGALPVAAVSTVSNDLVDITANANDPDAAVALANAMVKAYAGAVQAQNDVNNVNNVHFVGQQLNNVERDLKSAKAKLRTFKEQNHIFDVSQELTAGTTLITNLQQQAQAAHTEANAGATGASVQSDAVANNLLQKSADARANYETVLREYTPTSPEARAAAANLHDAQAQVNARVAALVGASANRAREADRALAQAKARAARLPGVEYGISLLSANVDSLADTYKTLRERFTQLSINKDANLLSPTSLTPATAAARVGSTWSRALLLALLAGCTMAALWAALLEQLDSSLHTSEEAELLLRLPALGTMPLLKGKTERRLSHIENPHLAAPALLEACRLLRTNLNFAAESQALRTILVTSADPGEGKSLSALNLATAMAMDGKSVILLDCDLRRPMQQQLQDLPLEPGFTNVVAGEAECEAALHQSRVSNLRVMPAGTLPSNPPELLGGTRTRQVLAQLQTLCDVVVIDSAPIMSLSDTQVLCSLSDGVLLVVAAEATSRRHVQRAQAALRQAGGRLVGVLFNKARAYNNPELNNPYYTYASPQQKGSVRGALN
jgi:capsular exopolysaccharide synthesis family protein